jgi:hypothetical protein
MKVLGLLLVVPLASARVVQSPQQIPISGEVVSDTAPSVGVHFTTSCAVAAARYRNGTTRDIVKVAGDAEYISLMSRWMDSWNVDPSIQPPQPTADTAILSAFFSSVRTAIETAIDTPITHITPTTFPLRPARKQDFHNALAVAGLASKAVYTEAETAYTSLAQSQSYTTSTCNRNQGQTILFLAYDNSSASATTYRLSCQQLKLISFHPHSNLGWWNTPVDSLPRARFWAQVQQCIVDVLGEPPGRIVLLGSHVDEELKSMVEEAFWREWEVDVGILLIGEDGGDSEWVAARGAAELGL